jgi:hypothetical protein
VAALDALDERLEPEVGEYLADSGQVRQRVVEQEATGLGVVGRAESTRAATGRPR